MAVSQIKIIKQGTTVIDIFESPLPNILGMKYFSGIGGGSTVSYIKSDANVLVDTGFDFESNLSESNIKTNRALLIHALKNAGLTPAEIDILFITHWHADHFNNYRIFPEAEIILMDQLVERHNLDFSKVAAGKAIAEGVEVLHTSGHTIDHASILVQTDPLRFSTKTKSGGRILGIGEVTVIVAGDAIVSPACYCMNKIWKYNQDFFSEEEARKSVDAICSVADYIITGHGGMIENTRKELYQ